MSFWNTVTGWIFTDEKNVRAIENNAASMLEILDRQYSEGKLTLEQYQAQRYAITGNADVYENAGKDVIAAVPTALAESIDELPKRINTGLSIIFPVWLRWLAGLALLVWLVSMIRPCLPSHSPAKKR